MLGANADKLELRAPLAYDGKLLSAVTRITIDSILGFYKSGVRDDISIKCHRYLTAKA